MTPEDTLDMAEDYLEREREILLSGRILDLERLEGSRASMLSALAQTDGDMDRILRLRALAERNGVLLEASADGVNRAKQRLGELRKAAGPIQSYSPSGGQCEIGASNPQFERKA